MEKELLSRGWVIVSGQPDRTLGAARSLIYVAAGSLELAGQVLTEKRGDQVLGYVPTIVEDGWERELPEEWTRKED